MKKVSQATLVGQVMAEWGDKPVDYDQLFTLLEQAYLKLPDDVRPAAIQRDQVSNRVHRWRWQIKRQAAGHTPVRLPAAAPPTPDAYRVDELRAAAQYLKACGQSLVQAKTLLDAVASITLS